MALSPLLSPLRDKKDIRLQGSGGFYCISIKAVKNLSIVVVSGRDKYS